jgi:hypothetical protein
MVVADAVVQVKARATKSRALASHLFLILCLLLKKLLMVARRNAFSGVPKFDALRRQLSIVNRQASVVIQRVAGGRDAVAGGEMAVVM